MSEVVKREDVEESVEIAKGDEYLPPSGPTSSNPGCWLIEANAAVRKLDPANEARQTVDSVLEAFRSGPRYSTIRYPIVQSGVEGDLPAVEFLDGVETLETKSLCYGTADVEALRQSATGLGFSMLGEGDGILARVDEEIHRYSTNRRTELEDYQSPDEKKRKKEEKAADRGKYRFIPKDRVKAGYHAWFADPSESNWNAFWGDLYQLLYNRIMKDKSEDGNRMWAFQRYEEFLNDFTGYFSDLLRRKRGAGVQIEKFMNYLNSAWKKRFITASKECADYERRHPRSEFSPEDDRDEEYAETFSLDDTRDYHAWKSNAAGECERPTRALDVLQQVETREEVLQRWEAKLETLDPALADLIGYKLAGLTDTEVGQRLGGLSRQAVGRLKTKAKTALAEVVA